MQMVLMPRRSPKQCNVIDCPELTYSGSYCDKHKTDTHKQYKRDRTDKREQAFYSSSSWIKLRNYKRMTQPLCEDCLEGDRLTPVDVCDHMEELKDNWSRRLDLSNLRGLCFSCHVKKTKRVQKEREKKSKVGIDGI